MRKFILNTLGFLLFLTAVACALEGLLYFQMQDKRAHVLEDWPDLVGLDVDFLLIGNSRTAEHAITERVEQCGLKGYNIAYDGYSSEMGAHRLEYVLEHCAKTPQFAIVQMDRSFLSTQCEKTNFPMKDGVLRYFFLDQININRYFEGYKNWRQADAFIPLLRYKGYPLMFFKHLFGWDEWDRRPTKGFWTNEQRGGGFELGLGSGVNPAKTELCGIDSVCSAHGIRLIGVIPPTIEGLFAPPAGTLDSSPAERIWDLTRVFEERDAEYFYDHAHFNLKGAELYSDSIAHRLKQLIET